MPKIPDPPDLVVESVRVEDLSPHPKNPRVHPDRGLQKLADSIREFGWTNPLLLSADGVVLAGHARLKAAKIAGLEKVPVIRLGLSGARAEAYMVADNRLQDETAWDQELLYEVLSDLGAEGIDLAQTGFEQVEIDRLLKGMEIPGEEPEFDESVESDVATATCPKCGHTFPL